MADEWKKTTDCDSLILVTSMDAFNLRKSLFRNAVIEFGSSEQPQAFAPVARTIFAGGFMDPNIRRRASRWLSEFEEEGILKRTAASGNGERLRFYILTGK